MYGSGEKKIPIRALGSKKARVTVMASARLCDSESRNRSPFVRLPFDLSPVDVAAAGRSL